ncbi:SH3 domain-containing protein [Niabella sp. W65]|nr:SH3 domain-containing protein [Niabella sp. W65]MCH7364957.1 SH3 domain-containing protein [Niabella sp. W65]ULT40785.1 SH3 domain-containing protein [Niabella sp. I65]
MAQQDETVDVIKKVNSEWTAIRTKDGVEGFVASQFLTSGDKRQKQRLSALQQQNQSAPPPFQVPISIFVRGLQLTRR